LPETVSVTCFRSTVLFNYVATPGALDTPHHSPLTNTAGEATDRRRGYKLHASKQPHWHAVGLQVSEKKDLREPDLRQTHTNTVIQTNPQSRSWFVLPFPKRDGNPFLVCLPPSLPPCHSSLQENYKIVEAKMLFRFFLFF